jgi:hypothetical protein
MLMTISQVLLETIFNTFYRAWDLQLDLEMFGDSLIFATKVEELYS